MSSYSIENSPFYCICGISVLIFKNQPCAKAPVDIHFLFFITCSPFIKKLYIPNVLLASAIIIGSGKLKYQENTISERTTKTQELFCKDNTLSRKKILVK